jgi:hypothetical protein
VWKAKRKADGVLVAIKQIMLGSISRREQADAAQEVSAQTGLIPPTCPVRDRWHRDLCRRCVLASTASARLGRVGAQALKRVLTRGCPPGAAARPGPGAGEDEPPARDQIPRLLHRGLDAQVCQF